MLGCIAFRGTTMPKEHACQHRCFVLALLIVCWGNTCGILILEGAVWYFFFFFFCKARQWLGLFSSFAAAAMQRISNEWGGMRGNHRLPAQVLAQVLGTDYTYATPNGAL